MPILVRFASAGAGPLSGALGGMITQLSGPQGVAVAAGLAAVAIGNMTRMAAEEQANIAGLSASLAAAGVSYRDNAIDIEALINKREELAFADDAQRDSLSRLVQMTGSLAEAQNLQLIAMDLARGKNMDLVAASTLVGKVAAGNVSILGRYGIVLKEGATATEALDAISARFAGQSEAYSKTAAAGWERFNNELANVQEDIGTVLLPIMLDASAAATDFLQQIQDDGTLADLGAAINTLGDIIATNIGSLRVFADGFQGVADAANTLSQSMFALSQGKFAESNELLAGLAERTQERLTRAYEFGEATVERFSDTVEESSTTAGGAVVDMSDRAQAGYAEMGDGAEETAVRVDAAMSDISDFFTRTAMSVEGNQAVYDNWAENVGESLIKAREAAQREGQALADAYEGIGSDMIDRFTDRVEGAQDVQDAWAESVGQAIIDANEEAAKLQEQANKEILAEQEKLNNELLREQERTDKEALALQEKNERQYLKNREEHARMVLEVTRAMGSDYVTSLSEWMAKGTVSVEYGAAKLNAALSTVPDAIAANITVLDDFTVSLEGLAPDWVAALQPWADEINAMPQATREALGLDLEAWDFYTEVLKQSQEEAVSAVEDAQRRIREALAWKEETNAKLGAPPGGRGLETDRMHVGAAPANSPARLLGAGWKLDTITGEWAAPGSNAKHGIVPFNPMARFAQGPGVSINGTVNVYAKAGVEQTLNELAAMRR